MIGKVLKANVLKLKTHGWDRLVRDNRTDADLPKEVAQVPHAACGLLQHLRRFNAPCKMTTKPWTQQQKDQAAERGPHRSALEYQEFLAGDMLEMVEKGQWMLLPYDAVQYLRNLRLSPIGVVPQKERRPRPIVDYTFSGVNQETVSLAPREAMQFGKALERILQKLVHSDTRHGPVYLCKVDISDGFYRIHVRPDDIPHLGVSFLPTPDGVPVVAFPLTLPMGWTESPPWFCVATETAADLANLWLKERRRPQPTHRLETLADTPPEAEPTLHSPTRATLPVRPPPKRRQLHRHAPLASIDLFVDDFIGLVQGSRSRRRRVRRLLFEAIDTVLRPLEETDKTSRQEPISVKKLKKGDACWGTRKTILGWIIDTVQETIELTPRRLQRLKDILDDLPRSKKRIAVKEWHKIVGELRSMSLAVPGLRGLFSLMQEAFRSEHRKRIRLTAGLHDFLDDIRHLVADLTHRPTRYRELVPTDPVVIGASDAAGPGMGGVFFHKQGGQTKAYLWRKPFPDSVQRNLVSYENPTGTITNSDLELAGTIGQADMIVTTVDCRERTIHTATDNTPALSWQLKGSATTTGPAAYLLRLQALHQRHHRYLGKYSHISGPLNQMADDTSRLWKLSNEELLSHFNASYPQETPWTMLQLSNKLDSSLISALHRTRPDVEFLSPTAPSVQDTGESGSDTAMPWAWSPRFGTTKTPFPTSKSSPSESAMDSCRSVDSLSKLIQSAAPYVRWARRSPYWGPKTSGLTNMATLI